MKGERSGGGGGCLMSGGGGGRCAATNSNSHVNGVNYILHTVSKMDTLAGVAIKYGVEVADIKRMNGLATDLQMFALKSLQIPLPGRHPPSPVLSNASTSSGERSTEETPLHLSHSNVLESLQSLGLKTPQKKVSPAMSTLQNYYGLKSQDKNQNGGAEGMEMTVYGAGKPHGFDFGLLPKALPISEPSSNQDQKSRNLANGFFAENGTVAADVPISEAGDGEGERSNEKSVRRRQKSEADSGAGPERLLKEENSGGSSGFSAITGKGLALRPKSASRTALSADAESSWLNAIPVGLGDSIMPEGLTSVRKSSSTPSLQEHDQNNSSSSVWPTSWNLKPDLQALSARPIFDGLPKPITGRKNKAALD